jgi:hypothetical protein
MRNLTIKLFILLVFLTSSSFGFLEYNTLKSKTSSTIQADSLNHKPLAHSIKNNLSAKGQDRKFEEETHEIGKQLAKFGTYVFLGIKKICVTLIRIVISI